MYIYATKVKKESMLANFFGKSNPANFIVIFLLFLCYATMAFFSDFSVNKSIEGIFMGIGLHPTFWNFSFCHIRSSNAAFERNSPIDA